MSINYCPDFLKMAGLTMVVIWLRYYGVCVLWLRYMAYMLYSVRVKIIAFCMKQLNLFFNPSSSYTFPFTMSINLTH